MIRFHVKCIDNTISRRRGPHLLDLDKIYTVIGIREMVVRFYKGARIRPLEFLIEEIPYTYYYARRFAPVEKINIILPDDFNQIDI